jgi:hypothetical protein
MNQIPLRQAKETEQKALEINLDDSVYGAFAEIGAGQEVARYFFQAGGAAGTIAKTMSAYDKTYSDEIYGTEPTGRYVCESRLYKMLDHEYELLEHRLRTERPDTRFFVFADTVSAINYARTIKGDGWMGIRFQLTPNSEPNDLVLHVSLLDNDNRLQQQAIGILGVNLIHACYRYHHNPELLLQALIDALRGRARIDMVRLTGPDFRLLDNRLLCLWQIKHGLTEVALFNPAGKSVHASEFLYKKYLLIVRGSFRPATLVNQDMLKRALDQFRREPDVESSKATLLAEITFENLCEDGGLDERDFLDRAEVLCALGQTVILTSGEDHQHLIHYFAEYKIQRLGLVMGARQLSDLIHGKYQRNMDGRLLSAFGELFTRNVKVYVYPLLLEGHDELMTAGNLPIPPGIRFLYQHLIDSGHIVDISSFAREYLHIYSKEVLRKIRNNETGWEELVPAKIAQLIRDKNLFGFPLEQKEFEY